MSMIEVYQGNTILINLAFTGENGDPLNLSGYSVYYIAKQNYSQTTGQAPINVVTTGHDNAAAGITHVNLTTGETSQCVGDYIADITLVLSGVSPAITTYHTDGLRILPNTFYSN